MMNRKEDVAHDLTLSRYVIWTPTDRALVMALMCRWSLSLYMGSTSWRDYTSR